MRHRKISFADSSEPTVEALLRGYVKVVGHEYCTAVVFSTSKPKVLTLSDIPAAVLPVKIRREVFPLLDLVAFVQLFILSRRNDFDVIHSVSAEAGLLSKLAGMFAGSSGRPPAM
jgi:hypothetical protein